MCWLLARANGLQTPWPSDYDLSHGELCQKFTLNHQKTATSWRTSCSQSGRNCLSIQNNKALLSFMKRLRACVKDGGRHFEYAVNTQSCFVQMNCCFLTCQLLLISLMFCWCQLDSAKTEWYIINKCLDEIWLKHATNISETFWLILQ